MAARTLPALLLLLPLSAPAAQPEKRFSARVEVQVRSAVVVLTDAKGKPLAYSPSLSDFEVREDGEKVPLVGIDAVAAEEGAAAAPAPARGASPSAPAAAAPAPRPRPRALRQVLYVDTTCLRQNSLPWAVDAIVKDLPRLLALGTLEIVVADPRPRTVLGAGGDAAAIRGALERLAKELPGRDRIARLRRQLVNDEESLAYDSVSLHTIDNSWAGELNKAATAREEAAIVVSSLSRLVSWGSAERPSGSGALYLVSDGFDTDLSIYGGGSLGGLVAQAGASLAAAGWIVMPVALGAPAELSSSLTADQNGWGRDSHPVFISNHRLDSLEHVAEETGGRIVAYTGDLTPALDGLATRWTISWRPTRPPDGKAHRLEIRSLSPGIVVHAARTVVAGTSAGLSTAHALAALRGEPVEADLPVEARVADASAAKGTARGTLVVRARLVAVRDLLPLLGGARMRVTLVVPIPGKTPFVHHEEREVKSLGAAVGWELHLPIEWPEKTARAAVVVEELGTGAWGAATMVLPDTTLAR